jgi:hypothetical protein
MCDSLKSEENKSLNNKFIVKKIMRKQMRSLSILEKHENIKLNDINLKTISNDKNLLIANSGLMCEISNQQLFNVLSIYGNIIDILLIPQKPYALVKFENSLDAINAKNELNLNFCHQLNRQLIIASISDEVWDQVFNNNKQTIDYYCSLFNETPNGLVCVKDFISIEEENEFLLFVRKKIKSFRFYKKKKKHFLLTF